MGGFDEAMSSGADQASSFQLNKGRHEVENLRRASVSPEQTGFPFADRVCPMPCAISTTTSPVLVR